MDLLGWVLRANHEPCSSRVRAVFEPTGSQRDAASPIFNLSDYRVIDAFEVPGLTCTGLVPWSMSIDRG